MQTVPTLDREGFVKWALCQFAGMGANEEQLAMEYQKMVNDDLYLSQIYSFFEEVYG